MSNIDRFSLGDPIVRAALGSVPVVGPALAGLYELGGALDRRRIVQMAAEVRKTVGDDELLASKLQEDERFIDLLVVAIESVRRTSWEGKRITMGRLLGHALADDADVDEDAALVSALAALEAPHFRYLAQVEQAAPSLHGTNLPEPYNSALIAQGVVDYSASGGPPTAPRMLSVSGLSPFGRRLLEWVRDGEADADTSTI